jgi:hypothetical protein
MRRSTTCKHRDESRGHCCKPYDAHDLFSLDHVYPMTTKTGCQRHLVRPLHTPFDIGQGAIGFKSMPGLQRESLMRYFGARDVRQRRGRKAHR